MAASTVTTALRSGAAFAAAVMSGIAYVAAPVPRLIRMEVVERLLAALRHGTSVTMTRIIAVVDMAVKAARSVEPGARSNEHSAKEPIRPIIPVRRTTIGSIVVVSVGTDGRSSNVDGDLCRT
jgi:hypothetical protein